MVYWINSFLSNQSGARYIPNEILFFLCFIASR